MKRILSVFLALATILTGLAGCQDGTARESSAISAMPVNMEPTDTFVIYRPPYTPEWLMQAIVLFRQMYPDVNVIIEDFSSEKPDEEKLARYRDRVTNELIVGEGTDVIFPAYLNLSLHKAMQSKAFLDLTPFFEQDETFNEQDFLPGVFEAGKYEGRQYIVPLRVSFPSFMARTPKLKEIGINQVETDMTSFLRQIGEATALAEREPGFIGMMANKGYFADFCTYGNLKLIDYQNHKVCPDPEGIRSFMEAYKLCYQWDYEREKPSELNQFWPSEGRLEDWFPPTDHYFKHIVRENFDFDGYGAMIADADGCYTDFMLRDDEGNVTVAYERYAAVRANTKNALNAYRFIQIMLMTEIQAKKFSSNGNMYDSDYASIRKEALELKFTYPSEYPYNRYADIILPCLSNKEWLRHLNQLYDTDISILRNMVVLQIAWESMEPFFNDKKSYEACYDELTNKLLLYLDE